MRMLTASRLNWVISLALERLNHPGERLCLAGKLRRHCGGLLGARCVLLRHPLDPVVGIAFAHWAERDLLDAGALCCIRTLPVKGDIVKAVTWALSVYRTRQGS